MIAKWVDFSDFYQSVVGFAAIHEAQLLSYLKLSDCKIGLLINFNMKILKDGIRRFRI
ncbi:MAG TPA: GxxExxY protein [Rhabdochlamydiaceae bacterium]|nr:GxxExxY protein [Rhabdochlamydiaceae bacterium]